MSITLEMSLALEVGNRYGIFLAIPVELAIVTSREVNSKSLKAFAN